MAATPTPGRQDIEVRGAEEFARLAKAARTVDRELRKELLKNVRLAGKPIGAAVLRSLGAELPQRGGLADTMAQSKVGVRNRVGFRSAGIRLEVRHHEHDLASIDRGELRHPVFGNRSVWVSQTVPAGLVSTPVEEGKPLMQFAVIAAMEAVSRKVAIQVGSRAGRFL